MKGIKSEAIKDGSIIASGHSYQSKEPGITITMNGSYEKQITKSQAQENELIYLSKPLGYFKDISWLYMLILIIQNFYQVLIFKN